ncbi:hypothetical protein [Novosphingobium sp. KN65.2]|uniref:hypothetical protein n=1 Tax=Novosphingobium sp. KN65.2 TaxID=1478134 RepID=UPI0005E3FD40|nr:hypothetical protein [Novosphingobium sp. KN65.2]CDO35831.1 hypothetical protein SPHV1_2270177 [Novosphingobium sp. KN65.2]
MSRVYRLFFCALAGLILVGADHPNLASERKQAEAQAEIADRLESIAATYRQEAERSHSPDRQTEPCEPGDDRRYSDLCAQWKAADAASVSATWAWVSGVVGTLSLVGVFAAIGLTYQANNISRRMGEAQTKAYLANDGIRLELSAASNPPFSAIINCDWRNVGNTPAFDFEVEYRLLATLRSGEVIFSTLFHANEECGAVRIDPSDKAGAHAHFRELSFAGYEDAISRGDVTILVDMNGTYRTVFNKIERVSDQFRSVKFYPSGNGASRLIEVKMARITDAIES